MESNPMRLRLGLFVGVAVGLSLGCSGVADGQNGGANGEGEGEGGPATPVPLACQLDEDCGAGLVCDQTTGDCVGGQDCSQNPDICAFCGDLTLVPPLECGFSTGPAFCDQGAAVCRRQRLTCQPCDDSAQCADGPTGLASLCTEGFCAAGCGACPLGFACDGGGCVPVGGIELCATSIDCRDGAACPVGERCTDLGVCLPVCQDDSECPLGEVCEDTPGPQQGSCVDGCPTGDARTENGVENVCHADGHYRERCPTAPCVAGTECDPSGVCQRTGCVDDNDCDLMRTVCDIAQGICVDGCNDAGDCGAFEDCDVVDGVGTCVPQGCQGKDLSCSLGQWCCGAEAFADAADCPSSVADGQCFVAPDPWCRSCVGDDDCADIERLGYASSCYELQDGEGNSLGKFCSVGCDSNADCPRGVDCVLDLPTADGATTHGCLDALCPAIAAARG
jgi:hypothetical protein